MKEKQVLNLYTAEELKEKFNTYFRKIEKSTDYIPVKIQDSKNRYAFKQGKIKKDFSIKYVLRKDIEEYIASLENPTKE